MAANKVNKKMFWLIKVIGMAKLTNRDRDFIADLVSEEARKTKSNYYFILHEIFESMFSSDLIIEGTRSSLNNLLPVIKDNFACRVVFRYL